MRRSTRTAPLVLLAALLGLLALLMQPSPARAASLKTRVGASTSFAAPRVGVATAETPALQPGNNATYDGVTSGDLFAADGTDLAPAIIGENMARVRAVATDFGGVNYEATSGLSDDALMAENRAQVEAWKAEGRPIWDIGPAPNSVNHPDFPDISSPFYAMERQATDGYGGYAQLWIQEEGGLWP